MMGDDGRLVVNLDEDQGGGSSPAGPPAPADEASAAKAPPSHRRRWLLLVLAFALLSAAGVTAWAFLADDGGGLADPTTVELPELDARPTALARYLRGRGADVVALLDLTEQVIEEQDLDESRCRRLLEEDLPAIAPLDRLARRSAAVPDEQTADMALAHLGAWTDFVAACARGENPDQESVTFAQVVLRRRIDEVLA